MASNTKYGLSGYAIFGLVVFLVFCLLFESYIALPAVVAWLGRWHPVVLHFPIVLLMLAVFLSFTAKGVPKNLIKWAAITALIAAISGFLLMKGPETKGDLLFWHQWLGVGTALCAALWYYLDERGFNGSFMAKCLQAIIVGLVLFTGHYGGMVTHGEDFLALSMGGKNQVIPENPLVYNDVIAPILDKNCVKCHNRNKVKGGLLMIDHKSLLEGGESGNTIVMGNADESELIKRLNLPQNDEKHMPPEGEKPLAPNEIALLARWIALGASDTLRYAHLDNNEPLLGYLNSLMKPGANEKWKALPKVADSTIAKFNSDYLTVRRLANGANALGINLYLPPNYDPGMLTNLRPIAENIVEMDVSGLPIGQQEMGVIAACRNLEWLEIDRTPITDAETDTLKHLSHLKLLKVYETKIGDNSIPIFKNMKSLKQIYIWNTGVSEGVLAKFKEEHPALFVNSGIDHELQVAFSKNDSVVKNQPTTIQ